MTCYDKGKDGTCPLECTPRTCPLLTVNWEALDDLNKDPRYECVIILHIYESSDESDEDDLLNST